MTLDTGDIRWQDFLFPTFFSRMTGYCKTSLNQRFYICNFSLVLTRALLQFPYLPLSLLRQRVVSVMTSITNICCMLTLCLALCEVHGASFIFAAALSGRCCHYVCSHARKPGRREERPTAPASQLSGGSLWIQAVLFQSSWPLKLQKDQQTLNEK